MLTLLTPALAAQLYAGQVAGANALLALNRSGEAVTGRYRYERGSADIPLTGTWVGDTLSLTATPPGGTPEQLVGQVDASGSFAGTWTLTAQKKTAPFSFSRLSDAVVLQPRAHAQSREVEGQRCKVELAWIEVWGLDDPAIEARVNTALRPSPEWLEPCTFGEGERSPTGTPFLKNDLLSVSYTTAWYGGAHPSYGFYHLTVDLRTGAVLRWPDVFPASLPARAALPSVLSTAVLHDVQRSNAESECAQENINALTEALPRSLAGEPGALQFRLDADGVRVETRNELPHVIQACGVEVTLPWSELAGMIEPTLLARLQ